ncbi:MAG TPA: hypothetical protein VD907_00530 [Verrucomicrobiae bacterium]|nr:hypothetical protein [Verrucomicrobiae bacterium]
MTETLIRPEMPAPNIFFHEASESSSHNHDHHHHEKEAHNLTITELGYEENLLALAHRTAKVAIPAEYLPPEAYIKKLEERFNLGTLRHRVGDAYPQLTPEQDAAVVVRFANIYRDIEEAYGPETKATPQSEAVHDHHHHDHDHDNCGHNHGIVHEKLGRFESYALSRIGSERAKQMAAVAFRATSLLFCPGDDIAAIGLQIYGSVSGEAHGHNEGQHQAILPNQSRVVLSRRSYVRPPLPDEPTPLTPPKPSLKSRATAFIASKKRTLRNYLLGAPAPHRRHRL